MIYIYIYIYMSDTGNQYVVDRKYLLNIYIYIYRGVLLTTHPLLVPRSWKSRAIPLPTLWATPGL